MRTVGARRHSGSKWSGASKFLVGENDSGLFTSIGLPRGASHVGFHYCNLQLEAILRARVCSNKKIARGSNQGQRR